MWFFLSLVSVALSVSPPERLLLIEDTDQPNFERALIHQALLINLLRDPSVALVPSGSWPPHVHRSVALQETADLLANDARRYLHALDPKSAAISASAARMRYSRVAALTGDLTGLAEALSLEAAAHLLQGHKNLARGALTELYTLEPTFLPDPALYNRSMQQAALEVGQEVQRASTRPVSLVGRIATDAQNGSAPGQAAVFVDGHFLGFGSQTAALNPSVRHHLWFAPHDGEPQGGFLCPPKGSASLPDDCAWVLWPSQESDRRVGQTAYGHVVAASRLATGQVDPHHPSLAARRIDTVLVLAYADGALRLTTFELRSGQRRQTQAAALVTNLWDVARIADTLRAAPPPLAAVPEER